MPLTSIGQVFLLFALSFYKKAFIHYKICWIQQYFSLICIILKIKRQNHQFGVIYHINSIISDFFSIFVLYQIML
jgi:hypothetical protein